MKCANGLKGNVLLSDFERRLCLGRPYGRPGRGAGRESEANSGEGFRRVLKMSPYRRAVTKGVDDAKRSSLGLQTLFVNVDGYQPVSHGQRTRKMPD